jgi:GUN4-like
MGLVPDNCRPLKFSFASNLWSFSGNSTIVVFQGIYVQTLLVKFSRILQWSTYSNGRFSWSVQKQIWEELGGQAEDCDIQMYEKWSKQLGWRVVNEWLSYLELDFTDEAPIGHFPAIFVKWSSWGSAWCGMETIMLFSKVDKIQFHQHKVDKPTQNIQKGLQECDRNLEQETNDLGNKFKQLFNPLNDLF